MSITDSVPKSFVFGHGSEPARNVATQGFLLVSGVGFRKYSWFAKVKHYFPCRIRLIFSSIKSGQIAGFDFYV